MKLLNRFLAVSICTVLFATDMLFAQVDDANKKETGKKVVQKEQLSQPRIRSTQTFDGAESMRRMETSVKTDKGLQALSKRLEQLGFTPENSSKDFYGERAEFEADSKQLTHELIVQNYSKPGSKDIGALATVRISVQGQKEEYHFSLVAPNGDFKRMREYTVDKADNVLEAHSWWTCYHSRLVAAGGTCRIAASTCQHTTSTVVEYIRCTSVRCPGANYAQTCCSCNCKPWCKQFAGCCKQ